LWRIVYGIITMKNTLWTFGDSFINTYSRMPIGENWTQMLAKKLGMELKDFGLSGSSLEYSTFQYTEHYDEIKEGDIVIVALTAFGARKWLNINDIRIQTPHRLESAEDLTEQDKQHYSRVFAEHDIRTTASLFTLFMHSLSDLKKQKGVKVVALPCFEHGTLYLDGLSLTNIPKVKGNLRHHISDHEVKGSSEQKQCLQFDDPRVNHMEKCNHIILAEKVYESLINDTDIDLTTGFHAEVLNANDFVLYNRPQR